MKKIPFCCKSFKHEKNQSLDTLIEFEPEESSYKFAQLETQEEIDNIGKQLSYGNNFAWCKVTVTVYLTNAHEIVGTDTLEQGIFTCYEDFLSSGYLESMIGNATYELNNYIEHVSSAIAEYKSKKNILLVD